MPAEPTIYTMYSDYIPEDERLQDQEIAEAEEAAAAATAALEPARQRAAAALREAEQAAAAEATAIALVRPCCRW